MEKFIYYNELYMIYKDLIKENNRDIFDLYYGENLSMQEIALLKKISKSRVGIIIKNVQNNLDNYEKVLKVYAKENKLKSILELNDINKIKKNIKDILKGE